MSEELKTIEFHFIKSNYFRVILVDGGIGGVISNNRLALGIYNERPAIPTQLTQPVLPDGTVGAPIGGKGKSGVVRELEAELIMDIKTAESIHEWLTVHIAKAKEIEAKKQLAAGEATEAAGG